MAAPWKKVVTKDALRRFMKEQKFGSSASKRIDHPLAKYNSLNQLVCALCNNVIKSDHMWQAHLLSKQHKEKVIALKTQGPTKPQHLTDTTAKRKAGDSGESFGGDTAKKKKTDSSTQGKSKGLPSDFFDDPSKNKNEVRERAKAAFLAGYSSSSDESSDEEDTDQTNDKPESVQKAAEASTSRGLPEDFFDPGNEPSTSEEPVKNENKKMSDILPEGFFDDPKMDAKVRNVEYRDKMDDEWDLFQKAMKEEAQVSEVIIEEEDEQANIDRNIDEIDDQIHRWQEVENLHVKKEMISIVKKEAEEVEDDNEDGLDEDLDQFLDWRAKKVIK